MILKFSSSVTLLAISLVTDISVVVTLVVKCRDSCILIVNIILFCHTGILRALVLSQSEGYSSQPTSMQFAWERVHQWFPFAF